ncbi:MAG: hypothetical protein ACK5P5_09600 [Pseudobdellovibrionaceae bacterium]
MKSDSEFLFDGELFPTKEKKFEELIFFVPFFDGQKKQLQRHIDMVNELGYDAFTFRLWDFKQSPLRSVFASSGAIGVRRIISDQIESLLNQFQQKKIIYSFSNPSAAALEAAARRKCHDIKAIICDSGPSANLLRSTVQLYSKDRLPNHKILATAASILLATLWSPQKNHDLKQYLDQFPQSFPLLSIRGWKDHLITPKEIDEVFELSSKLDWQKLSLLEAGHLNGLRDFETDYVSAVSLFLLNHSTKLNK